MTTLSATAWSFWPYQLAICLNVINYNNKKRTITAMDNWFICITNSTHLYICKYKQLGQVPLQSAKPSLAKLFYQNSNNETWLVVRVFGILRPIKMHRNWFQIIVLSAKKCLFVHWSLSLSHTRLCRCQQFNQTFNLAICQTFLVSHTQKTITNIVNKHL